ncbi:hypothetical protein [Roseovarius salinarum]|uniref:hypothetical protein n=1 Tax=Roseovarius salinarum TaxID=1981892 RepID=UPI000C32BEDA|nr:hypothetical protein [Roseovarius salinarum]
MTGAAPVAVMDALPQTEQALVLALRAWRTQAGRPARPVPALSGAPVAALGEILEILDRYGRRALACHAPGCRRVGGDEALFAHFVTTAATGDREDAMMLGALLVDAAMLLPLMHAAQQLGLQFARAMPGVHRAACRRDAAAIH